MLDHWAQSHVGHVRKNNEDSFASVPEVGFFVVADGMGGAAAGERASKIAVDTLTDAVRKAGESVSADTVVEAVELANKNIHWEVENDFALAGMGTTVTAAIVREDKVHLVNAGDSRAYRLSGGELVRLTRDHTWVTEMAAAAGRSEEDYRDHPYRHMLTKAVGPDRRVEPDKLEADFAPGDLVLLSSDGLHGVLSDEAIQGALATPGSLQKKADALVEATLELGAPDNVTVLLVRNEPAEEAAD